MTAPKPAAALSNDVAKRAWQRMLSGRRLDLLDPSPLDIEIEDIAHGLARVARWNGQTIGAHIFSVAQHTLLVEAVLRTQMPRADHRMRLAVLLHDAPEYVIGDMISPFKAVIGGSYKAVEKRLLTAIHIRFGLPASLPAEFTTRIKAADAGAAYLEATRLAGFKDAEARKFFGRPPDMLESAVNEFLTPWPAGKAEKRFLTRFKALKPDPLVSRCVRDAAGMTGLFGFRRPSPGSITSLKDSGPQGTLMLHVCSLAHLPGTVQATGASHVITVMADVRQVQRPPSIRECNHLVISMDDIIEEAEGFTAPALEHVERVHRLRPRLGSRGAHGDPLLRRHQPLDRERIRGRLRAQSEPQRA